MIGDLIGTILSSIGIPVPDRASNFFVAAAMCLAGCAFLLLAVMLAATTVLQGEWGGILIVLIFAALSFVSFWLCYRAAKRLQAPDDKT
ncbi:hypothetical protein FNZ56_01550 [Pseudoluteimonas lycopersici]|uniref:Uncharacterized protein n=1 Tax=Pseudoluteimonas lycopersici TaxID=1324796 RepID=A0A516V297_9GAMM|nr:hypothetical protein [Lysobacter lycopersici]QDQ72652.1 hypothetical protein FNZ56_01550 [Lysobacter lycopersici]